jgi:hypothetical protein
MLTDLSIPAIKMDVRRPQYKGCEAGVEDRELN